MTSMLAVGQRSAISASRSSSPAESALIASIVNRPLTWLHPRPLPLTSRPAYVVLNRARVMFSYEPGASCCPRGAAKSRYHHSEPLSTETVTRPLPREAERLEAVRETLEPDFVKSKLPAIDSPPAESRLADRD